MKNRKPTNEDLLYYLSEEHQKVLNEIEETIDHLQELRHRRDELWNKAKIIIEEMNKELDRELLYKKS